MNTSASLAAQVSPGTLCDLLLDAAMSSGVDTLWLEPQAAAPDRYDISMERQGTTIARAAVDAALGAAVVARLALITDIDLVSRRVASGRCVVRGPAHSAEIVVTTRPGRAPRAEVLVRHAAAAARPVSGPVHVAEGSQVGSYTIVRQLGAGGMGQVFLAQHRVLGRSCALKILSHDHGAPDSSGRFLREARAAARIKHPHIVDVFDFGHLADGRPYLVMELLDGRSLADAIGGRPLEPTVAIRIARQLASALAAAHAAGVIHADVSPSNVLITHELAKLVDFGLAQTLDDVGGAAGEPAEFVFGTPSYIAPELIRGLGAEPASDQYALGAVLYEMLTGEAPFRALTIRDLCIKHLTAPVPEVSSPLAALPPEVGEVIERCLAKRPAQRFASMAELHQALIEAEQAVFAGGWRRWLTP